MRTVICPYCNKPAELIDSNKIYSGRSFGMVWRCKPCRAHVGCHKNSKTFAPLGRLADKELRKWKISAHKVFDPLWRYGGRTRNEAYALVQAVMGLSGRETHIGKMDVAQCKELIDACEKIKKGEAPHAEKQVP